jgi:hypothetical protein
MDARLDITLGTQIFTLNSPSTSLASLELGSRHLRPLEFTLNSALVGLAPLPPRSARQHGHITHVTTVAVADEPTLPRQQQLGLAAPAAPPGAAAALRSQQRQQPRAAAHATPVAAAVSPAVMTAAPGGGSANLG